MNGIEQKGIVTSVRASGNSSENTYSIMADKVLQLKSNMQLELYDTVVLVDGNIKEIREKSGKDAYDKLLSDYMDRIGLEDNIRGISLDDKEYGKAAASMMPRLRDAAKLLISGLVSGAPIIVRFHNDGDGSAGAIALYRALSELQEKLFASERAISWEMNRSIAYTLESFYADKMMFGLYNSIEKPILLITDFGTSIESEEAIREACGTCDIIWLDHHVPYEGFPRELIKSYINVCDFGGSSSFTAGLLSCIFAQVLCKVDVKDLGDAALVSDYSIYADFDNEEAVKNSIILDYLTSSSNGMHSKPKQMDAILMDREKSDSVFGRANALLNETISTGIKNINCHTNANGIRIYVLDFGQIARLRLDYPLPGRYSSKLQHKLELENNGKTITIVHYGSYISVRLSRDIQESINLLEIIDRLKSTANYSISGGGHKQAASIKTDREHINEMIALLLGELGV
jgi:archaea-specific RecJ-like exonuclease